MILEVSKNKGGEASGPKREACLRSRLATHPGTKKRLAETGRARSQPKRAYGLSTKKTHTAGDPADALPGFFIVRLLHFPT